MNMEDYADLIQIEAEELSEALLGVPYFDLPPELQIWIRTRAAESVWPESMQEAFVPAA
jgi:hypothetical protein